MPSTNSGHHVPLREYVDTRIQALRCLLDERDRLTQLALEKAADAVDVRLQSMNELREQITSERGQYTTNIRLDAVLETINVRLNALQSRDSFMAGRDTVVGVLAGLVGAAVLTAVFSFMSK